MLEFGAGHFFQVYQLVRLVFV